MAESEVFLVTSLESAQIDQLVDLFRGEFWSRGRKRMDVERMLSHSDIILGAIDRNAGLVGFVRGLTDYVYKATIYDLIVRPDWRGRELGRMLLEALLFHPELKAVEQFDLNCVPEMARFYEKWGFTADLNGLLFMRRLDEKAGSQ